MKQERTARYRTYSFIPQCINRIQPRGAGELTRGLRGQTTRSATGRFLALEVHDTRIYQSIGGSSAAIDTRPGHMNRLEVVGIGSDFVFLINGQQVAQLAADIAPGQIGLGVDAGRRASEARVEFSEFEVHAP